MTAQTVGDTGNTSSLEGPSEHNMHMQHHKQRQQQAPAAPAHMYRSAVRCVHSKGACRRGSAGWPADQERCSMESVGQQLLQVGD